MLYRLLPALVLAFALGGTWAAAMSFAAAIAPAAPIPAAAPTITTASAIRAPAGPARLGAVPTISVAGAAAPVTSTSDIPALLCIPDVTETLPVGDGRLAWVERTGGSQNLWFRGADGVARKLTDYRADDGQPIHLLTFLSTPSRIVFRRGSAQNPANLADPPPTSWLVVPAGEAGVAMPAPRPATAATATASTIRETGSVPAASWKPAAAALTDVSDLKDGEQFTPSHDGRRIAFVRGHDILLLAADHAAPATRLLTARSRVGGLAWSLDDQRLAYVVDRAEAGRGEYSLVAVVDIATRRNRFLAPGIGADHNPVWSADGRWVGFIRFGYQPRTWRFEDVSAHSPFSVITADADTGAMLTQWRAPQGRGNHFSGFAAGEDYDVFARTNLLIDERSRLIFPWERSGFRALYALAPGVAVADADIPQRLTDPGLEVDGVAQSPDGKTILYWSPSHADPERLDLYRVGDAAPLKPALAGDMRFGAQFLGNDELVWREAGARTPEHLRIGSLRAAGAPLSGAANATQEPAVKLPEAETFTLQRPGGLTVHAILYRSLQAPRDRPSPLIVHAHGGSRDKAYPVWQTFFGYPPALRHLLLQGFHVLSVNYRSGTGYGLDFREPASYGAKGNEDVEDVIAAAQAAAQRWPFIDAHRMIVYGHSYGGHIVATALARSDVFAAGIDSAGVGDWVYEMQSDSGAPLPLNLPERLEVERQAWANSSVSQLDRWGREPILFLHGDADASAALRQTIELYQQLERRGVPAEAVIFPGEAHALQLEVNQRRYLEAIDDFLRRHGFWPDTSPPRAIGPANARPCSG